MTPILGMAPAIWAALIAFVAAILGGLVQAAFASSRERRAFRWATNRDNYGAFLESIAGMGSNPNDGPQRQKFLQMSIEAKAKILLQGSPDVVRALNAHQSHPIMGSEESYEAFTRLTEAMRKDIGGKQMADFRPLVRSILFQGPSSQ